MPRYDLTAQRVDDSVKPGTLRNGLWKVPEIDMTSYNRYAVTAADDKRIDMIAYRMYGDVNLWWAIAIVNNIANPLRDLEVGVTLRIPLAAEIARALARVG